MDCDGVDPLREREVDRIGTEPLHHGPEHLLLAGKEVPRGEDAGDVHLLRGQGGRERDLLPARKTEGQPSHLLAVPEAEGPGGGPAVAVDAGPEHLVHRCPGDVQAALGTEQVQLRESPGEGRGRRRFRQVDRGDAAGGRRRGCAKTTARGTEDTDCGNQGRDASGGSHVRQSLYTKVYK